MPINPPIQNARVKETLPIYRQGLIGRGNLQERKTRVVRSQIEQILLIPGLSAIRK